MLCVKILFEWVHMQSVFDCTIECAEMDETHNFLAVTVLGRIAIFQVGKESSSEQFLYFGK